MTFEYTDPFGNRLEAEPGDQAVKLTTYWSYGDIRLDIPLDRVEEVVAGIRDVARTAARQTTGQDDTGPTLRDRLRRAICEAEGFTWDTDMLEPDEYGDHADAVLQVLGEPLPERKEFADPTTADDPTPLRWGHGDVLHGDDDTTLVCFSGPDREPYWLELESERAAALRDDLTPPAVGQPAEAHGTDVWTPANLHFLRFALGCAAA